MSGDRGDSVGAEGSHGAKAVVNEIEAVGHGVEVDAGIEVKGIGLKVGDESVDAGKGESHHQVDAKSSEDGFGIGAFAGEYVAEKTASTDGKIYVSVIGEYDKDGDGRVLLMDKNKVVPFADGLDDPKGIASYQGKLYVADKNRIWRIDEKGHKDVFVAAKAFPRPPLYLNGLAVDQESGLLYVTDSGNLHGKEGAIFRINQGGEISLVTDAKPTGRRCTLQRVLRSTAPLFF